MPYPNIDSTTKEGKEKTAKMERCVERVMAQGHEKDSAIAICYNSIVSGENISVSTGSTTTGDGITWIPYTAPDTATPFYLPMVDWEARDFDKNVGDKGVDRDKLKDSDFVFGDERKFPVVTSGDVSDAVSSWGRYKGKHSFAEFKSRLKALCARKGFTKSLPKDWGDNQEKASLQWSEPTADDIAQAHAYFGSEDSGELLKFSGAVLCKARRNRNGDAVDEVGLEELAKTLPLKAVDDEHDEKLVVGFFVNARVQNAALLTDGILFARRFPEIAAAVQKGEKKLSVEAWANKATCSECAAEFASPREYCAHLLGRRKNGATRLLSGLTATGGATVKEPAEPDAVFPDRNGFLMIASLSEDDPDVEAGCDTNPEGENGDMDKDAEISKLQAELAEKIAELESRVTELDAALKANADLTAKLQDMEQTHGSELQAATLRSSRALELIEAGYTRVEVEGLAERLAAIDQPVYDLLKNERMALKASQGNKLEAGVQEPKKNGNQVLGGGESTPALGNEWAVFDRFVVKED
jgi:hypothetical protein